MIYLHFRFVDEIDFSEVLNTSEQVEVVVPRVTISELDKHKNTHPNSKIRERAKKTLRLIEEAQGKQKFMLKNQCVLSIYNRHPTIDFAEIGLDKESKDDILVATILEYCKQQPKNKILLISDDFGPRTTANSHGITSSELSETFRLPPQEDPVEVENRSLKRELHQLKTALPKLKIGILCDGDFHNPLKLQLPEIPAINQSKVKEIVSEKSSKFQPIQPDLPEASVKLWIDSKLITVPVEVERYNREVKEYPKRLIEHYLREYPIYVQHQLAHEIEIFVENDGSQPAEDVDVWLHFPDGCLLYHKLPALHNEPLEPITPRSASQMLNDTIGMLAHSSLPSIMESVGLDTWKTSIRKTNSYEVDRHFDRIKHNHRETFPKIYLTFDKIDSAKPFSIKYRITAANLISPVEGELSVVIEKIPYVLDEDEV
jgi:hypothetical protein